MAKDTFYFSHDYNARNDEKIKKLIRKYNMSGYGIYWSIVEDLYNNGNSLQLDYNSIAYDLRVDEDVVKGVINDFNLFVIEGDFFGSLSIQKRLDDREKLSKKRKESAGKRWGIKNSENNPKDAKIINSDAIALNNDAIALNNDAKSRKMDAGKERKGKERKIKENNTYTDEEKKAYESFKIWATENAPNILKMKEPITIEQLLKIKQEFEPKTILRVFSNMHNYQPLFKNVSANLTFRNWANNEKKQKNNSEQSKGFIEIPKDENYYKKENTLTW